jgi:hypothetical protein
VTAVIIGRVTIMVLMRSHSHTSLSGTHYRTGTDDQRHITALSNNKDECECTMPVKYQPATATNMVPLL